MVTAQQLLDEGLIPNNAGTSGGEPVQWGAYDVIHFGEIRPEEFRKMSFTPDDFYYIYLQIEGLVEGEESRIAVKMNIDVTRVGHTFDKERVRRARQKIQDYFVRNVVGCRRTRFKFTSPKDTVEHAYWLTVARVPFNNSNYSERITATRRAFDALKK